MSTAVKHLPSPSRRSIDRSDAFAARRMKSGSETTSVAGWEQNHETIRVAKTIVVGASGRGGARGRRVYRGRSGAAEQRDEDDQRPDWGENLQDRCRVAGDPHARAISSDAHEGHGTLLLRGGLEQQGRW